MKTTGPDLKDRSDALTHLNALLRVVYDGLVRGVYAADAIDGTNFAGAEKDPLYWSFSVRRTALAYMSGLHPTGKWELGRKLSMAGIEMRHGPAVVRVWKARDDGPPAPGSHAQVQFCSQMTFGFDVPGGAHNFICDWSVDQQRRLTLHLSRPIEGWRYRDKPRLEWRQMLDVVADDEPRFVGDPEHGVMLASVLDATDLEASGDAQ